MNRPIQLLVDINHRRGTRFSALPSSSPPPLAPRTALGELRHGVEDFALALSPDKTLLGALDGQKIAQNHGATGLEQLPTAALGMSIGLVADCVEAVTGTFCGSIRLVRAGLRLVNVPLSPSNMVGAQLNSEEV